jgi:hypothetical protein
MTETQAMEMDVHLHVVNRADGLVPDHPAHVQQRVEMESRQVQNRVMTVMRLILMHVAIPASTHHAEMEWCNPMERTV